MSRTQLVTAAIYAQKDDLMQKRGAKFGEVQTRLQ